MAKKAIPADVQQRAVEVVERFNREVLGGDRIQRPKTRLEPSRVVLYPFAQHSVRHGDPLEHHGGRYDAPPLASRHRLQISGNLTCWIGIAPLGRMMHICDHRYRHFYTLERPRRTRLQAQSLPQS